MRKHKGIIALPFIPIIVGIISWSGVKAIPAIWQHWIHRPSKVQVELSKDLCEKHNDCEAEKTWAMPVKETHESTVTGATTKDK